VLGLAVRFFAMLRMTRLNGHDVKCPKVMHAGLVVCNLLASMLLVSYRKEDQDDTSRGYPDLLRAILHEFSNKNVGYGR
jgi:hypothetical protein